MARYRSHKSYLSNDESVEVALFHSSAGDYRVSVYARYSNGVVEVLFYRHFDVLKSAKRFQLFTAMDLFGTSFKVC